jgi:ribonuclease R
VSNDRPDWIDPILQAKVLDFLENRKRKGATHDSLIRDLSGEGTDEELAQALQSLARSGEAVEWHRRWYALRYIDFEVGTVKVLERGDAVIRTGAAGEPGLFVRRRHLKGALNGDLVLLKRTQRKGKKSSSSRLPEATVTRVLSRSHEHLVGTVEVRESRRWLVPFDPKLNLEIEIEGSAEVKGDDYVVVAMTAAAAGKGAAQGRIVEILGSLETPGVDVMVVLRHFGIPEVFPRQTLEEAAAFPTDPEPASFKGREDLRDATLITVDGETARDFDDAISLHRKAGGGFELGVHIADVSTYVQEGSALDREAYRRGTSVYYPDRAIPMLPEGLSNGLCSLRPEVPRLALSAFLSFDSQGVLDKRRFAETVIRSTRRMTYKEVQQILDGNQAAREGVEPSVLELIKDARSLMKRRLERRLDRGSIDFDLPEGDVVLDSEGYTVGVRPEKRTAAHRIIEEFMIAANEAVAMELTGHDRATLHRIHTAPDPRDLEELREVLAEMGIDLEGDLEALHPRVLQNLLLRVEGRPEESFVSSLVLRSMQRAVYHPESKGHYALSSDHYLHFTSPIRRYPDLLVHRQLKALLNHRKQEQSKLDEFALALPTIADHCSDTERRAERSERLLLQWKLVRFLAGRLGDGFRGRITGVQPFGLFVQLTEYYVDGLVPVRSMSDDYYVFEPENHRLVGRDSGRQYRLADEVQVILESVDERRRGLNLKLDLET